MRKFFRDWNSEIVGGLTTFFTMSYIVVVNPSILATPGTGLSFSGVMSATVLLCFAMTLLMGLYAKLPFAVAPGMGINAFFTFNLILGRQIPWPVALGAVFWAGVLFLLISLTPLRMKMAQAIPKNLRVASAAGIGIFLSFIGLKNSGLVVADPVTFVKFGNLGAPTLFSLGGLFLILFFQRRRHPLAFLLGIAGVTALCAWHGDVTVPDQYFSAPDFSSFFGKFDPVGALRWALVPAIFSFLFTDFFDSISTFVGVAHATKLLDEAGEPRNLKQGLVVDAWATLLAGVFGTSSGTAYIESSAGIEAGGRSGRSAVVTALCFLPCFFLAPLVATVPKEATAPVLIIVGALMFRTVGELKTDTLEELLPAFLTLILIPLSFSITQGLLWGFVSHLVLMTMAGRRREISPLLWGIGGLSLVMLSLEQWAH